MIIIGKFDIEHVGNPDIIRITVNEEDKQRDGESITLSKESKKKLEQLIDNFFKDNI